MPEKNFPVFLLILTISFFLPSATYKDKNIDGTHFKAQLWMKDSTTRYRADVVFQKKAANIVFDEQQMLPPIPRTDRFFTLYLFDETIEDPENIPLKQVKPPVILSEKDKNPDNWEIVGRWFMSIAMDETEP